MTPKTTITEPSESVARRTFVALWVIFGFVGSVWFLYRIRQVVLLLLVALVFALALAPLVGWLQRRRVPRGFAAMLAVLLLIGVLGAVTALILPPVVTQSRNFIHSFPQIVREITHNAQIQSLDRQYHLVEQSKDVARRLPQIVTGNSGTVLGIAQRTLSAIVSAGLVLTLTFFLLVEGPGSWRRFLGLLAPGERRRIDRISREVARSVSGYVSGNLLISVIAGLTAFIVMWALKIPYALPLAVVVAFLDLIPIIGATLGTIAVGLVAITVGWTTALLAVFLLLIYQQVENNVIQPVIYARTVKLSPLLILLATIIGGTIGGIVGVLLAIPVASTIQIIAIELIASRSDRAA